MTKLVNIGQPAGMVRGICQTAGAWNLIDDTRVSLARHGVIEAVRRHNTAAIFDWLIDALSYQGISDRIAAGYMNEHGRVRWDDIAVALAALPNCSKLRCYWSFYTGRSTSAIRRRNKRSPRMGIAGKLDYPTRRQVMEDALCNWQKSPMQFKHFRG